MSLMDDFKELRSHAEPLHDPKIISLIDNVHRAILELQGNNVEFKGQVMELGKEIESLKEQLTIKETLVFRNGYYWSENPDGGKIPHCSRCWDAEKIAIKLYFGEWDSATCPNCKYDPPS